MFITLFILAMIVVNAFYVAAEFGTVSVRRSAVRKLADDGHKTALALLPILENSHKLDSYIATCQIGITFSSIVLGAFGQAYLILEFAPWVENLTTLSKDAALSVTALVVLIGFTGLQMLMGELVPKSIALRYPTQTALLLYKPMIWSMAIFAWFIVILNGSGNVILGMMGVKHSDHRHIHSPSEIDFLIGESRRSGELDPNEHVRLKKALTLSSKRTQDIQIPKEKVTAISIDVSAAELRRIVYESPYTRFPVYSQSIENVIGMVHSKDVVSYLMSFGKVPQLKDIIKPLPSVPSAVTADRLLTLLRKRKAHQAMVIDKMGNMTGIVTLEDVLREVMGTVGDEFKTGKV
jgi:CBS domain containing-hemolysin-like protein